MRQMRRKVLMGAFALLVVVGVLGFAVPALARAGEGRALGLRLRWSGVEGSRGTVVDAAKILGMTVEETMEAKVQGKTLEELALARGLSLEDLVDKIVEARMARLETLVQEGKVTAEAAEAARRNMTTNIERAVRQVCSGDCLEGTGGLRYGQNRGQGRGNGSGYGQATGQATGQAKGQAMGQAGRQGSAAGGARSFGQGYCRMGCRLSDDATGGRLNPRGSAEYVNHEGECPGSVILFPALREGVECGS